MKYAWIKQQAAKFPVKRLCRLMNISRSAYYAWLDRSPTSTEKEDQALTEMIVKAFKKRVGQLMEPDG